MIQPDKRYVHVVNVYMFELVKFSCGFPQCSGGVALGLVTICHSEGDFTNNNIIINII